MGKGIKHLYAMQIAATAEKMNSRVEGHDCSFHKNYGGKKPANRLTAQIIDFIKLRGGQAERINTMGINRGGKKVVTDVCGFKRTIGRDKWTKSGSTPGSADISATIKGRSVKIEVKIGKDNQKDEQTAYQDNIERAGGVYYIARDFESFYDWYVVNFEPKLAFS
jgi:hypothetical protein